MASHIFCVFGNYILSIYYVTSHVIFHVFLNQLCSVDCLKTKDYDVI